MKPKMTGHEYKDTFLFHHAAKAGKHGKPIIITKFRTMKRGSHATFPDEFARGKSTKMQRLQSGQADKRITRFGRFLRKTNLDELPQLMNYAKRELALVGIRPATKREYDAFPADIRAIYDEVGPALAGIQYSCKQNAPTHEEIHNQYREFYKMWKKNKAKANFTYVMKIVLNRLRGRGWSA
ncbi:MAG TPA: sugar transferase [archaeon]|nr:sugar transferase [archaeon]